MMVSEVSLKGPDAQQEVWPGEPPRFPEGPPQFEIVEGDPSNEKALESIIALHELYAVEGKRLAEASGKRQVAQKERADFLEKNPPKPKDLEIYLWPSESARLMKQVYEKHGQAKRPTADFPSILEVKS